MLVMSLTANLEGKGNRKGMGRSVAVKNKRDNDTGEMFMMVRKQKRSKDKKKKEDERFSKEFRLSRTCKLERIAKKLLEKENNAKNESGNNADSVELLAAKMEDMKAKQNKHDENKQISVGTNKADNIIATLGSILDSQLI